jgi:hypothetical protein
MPINTKIPVYNFCSVTPVTVFGNRKHPVCRGFGRLDLREVLKPPKSGNNSYNRVYYHMPVIKRTDYKENEYVNEIVKRLEEYFLFLKQESEEYM